MILLNQTLKNVETIYRDVGGYDMKYDEYEQFYRKAWEGCFTYLHIDRSKQQFRGRFCNCNENKNTWSECTSETNLFSLLKPNERAKALCGSFSEWKKFYSVIKRDDLENLNGISTLQNQVKDSREQDKLREQNIHEDMKKSMNSLLIGLTIRLKM